MPNSYTLSQKEHSMDNLKSLFTASEKRLDEISLLIKDENECECEQCFRCINLCPQQSIQYLDKTAGKFRYKNPYVKLDDLIKKLPK